MASTFGWLDADNEQRRRMLEVVDLFKEEGTLDELGIGSIRDALADSLFPGTSSCTPGCVTSFSSRGCFNGLLRRRPRRR